MASDPLGGTLSSLGELPQLNETPQTTRASGLLDGKEAQSIGTVGPSLTSLLPQLSSHSTAADLTLDVTLGLPETSAGVDMSSRLRGLFIFAYISIFFISLFGNSLVCNVIMKRRRAPSATGLFVINLAVVNFFITLLNTPFTLVSFINSNWIFGYVMCHLSSFLQLCSVSVSVLTFTALAIDRHQVTVQPLRPRMSAMTGSIFVVIIWILAICFSLPLAVYQRFPRLNNANRTNRVACLPEAPESSDSVRKCLDLVNFYFLYILPLLVIMVTYLLMAKKLWLQNFIQDTSEYTINYQRKRKMTLKMLVIVVVVFTICWLPFRCYEVLLSSKIINSHETTYFAFHWLAMSSACYPPFIYYHLNLSFRKEVRLLLYSWWDQALNRGNDRESSIMFNFCRTWGESSPSQDINEEPRPSDQIDVAGVLPTIETN